MYKNYSFGYVIININQQYFAIICVCLWMCVILSNFTIKSQYKKILTKHMKLFFVQS